MKLCVMWKIRKPEYRLPTGVVLALRSMAVHRRVMNFSGAAAATERVNKLLYTSERELTRDDGLPGRPWFRHHIYAPGFYTGYGVKTLPGVREAIEERQYELAEQEIHVAAEVIAGMARRIRELTAQ